MKKVMGKGENRLDWRSIGLGTAVGLITMLTMSGVGAWLLERELVRMEWINYLAAVILLTASFAGAGAAGASVERWLRPVLTGTGLWLTLVLIHVLVFGGAMEGGAATAMIIMGGSGAAVLLGRGGKGRKKRSRRYRNR